MTRINVRFDVEPDSHSHVIGSIVVENPNAEVINFHRREAIGVFPPVSDDYETTVQTHWDSYPVRTFVENRYTNHDGRTMTTSGRCLMVPSVHPIMDQSEFLWSEGLLATRREIALLLMWVRQPDMYNMMMRDETVDPYEFCRLDRRESSTDMCNLINDHTDLHLRNDNVIANLMREAGEFSGGGRQVMADSLFDMARKVEEVSKTIPYPDVLNVVRRIDIGE